MSINTNPKCKDARGRGSCFACHRDINGNFNCGCLSDTKEVPCPFYKTKEQVLKEDPNYYNNLVCYRGFKSPRKAAK